MIVFWGLVVVGLGFSTLLLSNIQKDTIEKRGAIADSIAYRISTLHPDKDLATLFSASKLKAITSSYTDVSIDIYRDNKLHDSVEAHVHSGDDKDVLVRNLLFADDAISQYEVHILFPSFNKILHAERKKMLLVLGCMLLLFGVFLKLMLERILKQPVDLMVKTARTMVMSSEKTYGKFNENRNDELGYLARFMNEAIAAMQEHERSAWHAQELAEVTLESINDGVVTTNRNGNIDFINPVAEALFGWRLKDVKSKPLAEVFQLMHAESGGPIKTPIGMCLSNGRSINMETDTVLLSKNGMKIPVVVSVAPIKDHKQRVLGIVMTFHKKMI